MAIKAVQFLSLAGIGCPTIGSNWEELEPVSSEPSDRPPGDVHLGFTGPAMEASSSEFA